MKYFILAVTTLLLMTSTPALATDGAPVEGDTGLDKRSATSSEELKRARNNEPKSAEELRKGLSESDIENLEGLARKIQERNAANMADKGLERIDPAGLEHRETVAIEGLNRDVPPLQVPRSGAMERQSATALPRGTVSGPGVLGGQ